MKIASLVLSVRPDHLGAVREELVKLAGVRVHDELPDSRLVVTVEDTDGADPMAQVLALQALPGVLATTLAYEYCDDEPIPLEIRS